MSLWLHFLLSTPVVLWCGWPFFQRAWASFKNLLPTMFPLLAIGDLETMDLDVAAMEHHYQRPALKEFAVRR